MLDKSTKKKEDRICKIAIRNADMKQNDNARVLNISHSVVSRPLKEHREMDSIKKRKRFELILECKELVTGTLNAQKYQDEILESVVRSPLDSLDGQSMVLRDDIARPHCTRIIEEYKNQQNIASLPQPSLLQNLNPIGTRVGQAWLTCFKPGTGRIKTFWEFCYTLLHEWDRISCLERMYPVNLMMKMCQVVIRQCEGYTQHKLEVVNYYEPFRDFLHQIIKVYAPKESFEEITTIVVLL